MKTLTCTKCKYEWLARKNNPKECPNCKSRNWNKGSNNLKFIVLALFILTPSYAMGRLPSDPATYQDILDAEAMTSATNNREIAHHSQDQSDIQAANARLDTVEETKIMVEGAVRIYDGKRIALEAFNSYDVKHSQEFAFGTRITLKLGSSYEERQLKKQAQEIAELRELFRKDKRP